MSRPGRPVALSVLWMLIGALALVAVTAAITTAVSSLRTVDQTAELLAQLRDANTQIASLSADNAATRAAADRLDRQNRRLIRQNAHRAAQIDALIRSLREHGIDVPKVTRSATAGGSVASPPKVPAAHSGVPQPRPPRPTPRPASPAPVGTTQPSPTATANPLTELTCRLAPVLCP